MRDEMDEGEARAGVRLGVGAREGKQGDTENEATHVLLLEGSLQHQRAQRFVSPDTRSLRHTYYPQIVVEKLTKNVNENHLREIFGTYGPIKDVDLPISRQCKPRSCPIFEHSKS